MTERGYGWEKLMSETFYQEYRAEQDFETYIAPFKNVYGRWVTWDADQHHSSYFALQFVGWWK